MALTFNETYDRVTDITNDSTTTGVARAKDLVNEVNQSITALRDWYFLNKERTATSVASQNNYQVPGDYGRLVSIWTVVGGVTYYPKQVFDMEYWQYLNSSAVTSDITTHFYIFENNIYLYPTPASTDISIHIFYRRKAIEMTQDDYSTGTISVSAGSTGITGSGTTFTSAMVGRYIQINGIYYEIASYTNGTSIDIVRPSIAAASGATFNLGEMSPIPSEFHDMIWKGAVADYYDFKGDSNPWRVNFEKRLALLISRYGGGQDTSGQVIRRSNRSTGEIRNPNDYPSGLS